MVRESSLVVPLATMVVCVVLLQCATAHLARRKPFKLEELVSTGTSTRKIVSMWVNGSTILYEDDQQLFTYDITTKTQKVCVPKEIYSQYAVAEAVLSDNGGYVLIGHDAQKVFRHAAFARYVVYSLRINHTITIGGGERLQLAKWGTQGSQLIYIYKNNIYYLSTPDAEPIPITSDGVPDVIFNGQMNYYPRAWLHPVETVGMDAVATFSPDGTKLLFVSVDETLVRNATFIRYGRPGALENQYAELVNYRFRKPGSPKAVMSLKMATLPSGSSTPVKIQQLLPPVDVVGEESTPRHFKWINDTTVMAWWSNRAANVIQDVIYSISSDLKEISGEKGLREETKDGWVTRNTAQFQLGNWTTTYMTILWQPVTSNESYPHLVKVTGNSTKAITSGELTVTKIYGWAANGTVYYQATEEGLPSTRQVYAVEEGGDPRCLSCSLAMPEGSLCSYATAAFSSDYSYYHLHCTGPHPKVSIVQFAAEPDRDVQYSALSEELREFLSARLLPRHLDTWVELEDNITAQVRLLLPPDLDVEGSEKRPAIVHVKGYPSSQQISDSFSIDIASYFTTARRYVVVYIDGHGSGGKGARTLFSIYRRLGSVEVEDQINVTKWLTQKYPFIDSSRIGIWGWHYGGFVTAMALAKDEENVFRCGVSVSPITSLIYSDAATTERYMGLPTPEDNEAGYNASDVTRLAARFANKKFLLIHGTADETHLYQNSMALARALEEEGVLFEQQSYPDERAWIENLELHLYRTVDDFFERCFDRSALLLSILKELFP